MTHDTMKSKILWKSSIEHWEEAHFDIAYEIKEQSKIHLKVSRFNKIDEIEVTVRINSLIPSLYIRSTYPNFEKIKFSGKYNITNFNGLIGVKLEVNSRRVFQLISELDMSADYKNFKMRTTIEGQGLSNIFINFSYILGTPNKFNFMLKYEEQKMEILAIIYTPEIAFSILFMTPFESFEEFTISGQFGATALKSMYTFKNYRVRRSMSFEYEKDGEDFQFSLSVPHIRIKRFSIRNIPSEKLFSFELHDDNDFALGAIYDFNMLNSSGSLLLKVQHPTREVDYAFHLSYDIPDMIISNGINAKIFLKQSNLDLFTGKISRTLGRTFIEATTPFKGWNYIKLEMHSDWQTTADIHFQRDLRITNIHLEQHGTYDYNIIFKTPFQGYENIQIKSQKLEDTITIKMKNNDLLLSEISLRVQLTDVSKAMGKIEVKWDAANDIFVHINASFDGIKAILSVSTSFEQVKTILIEIAIQKNGFDRKTKAIFKVNDRYIQYESHISWTNEEIKSHSRVKTNIDKFGFRESQTVLKLEYSKDMSSFFKLFMETTTDDTVTFNTNSTLKINFKGAEIKVFYNGEFPVLKAKVDAFLHVDSKLQTRFELKGNWSTSLFHMRLILTGKDAIAKFDSNIEKFETLKGRAVWTIAEGGNSDYGVNIQLENCKDSCSEALSFRVVFDTKPFSKLNFKLLIPGYLNETLILKFSQNSSLYSTVADYTGWKTYHVNATIHVGKRSVNILIHNKSDGRKWRLKTNAEFELLESGSVLINVQLIVFTPFTQDFKAIVVLDIENAAKQFELTFKYGIIDASLRTKFLWTIEKSDMLFRILCPSIGIQAFGFEGRRKGIEDFHYHLLYNGKEWDLKSKFLLQEDSFDVTIKVMTPLVNYVENKLKLVGRTTSNDKKKGKIELIIGNSPFYGEFKRDGLNFDIEMTSRISGAKKFILKTDVKKCNYYKMNLLWNERKVDTVISFDCNTFETKLDVETDFDICKILNIEFYPKKEANFDVSLKFKGMNLDLGLTGNIWNMEQNKYFIWNIDFNQEPFRANLSYSIDGKLKKIDMLYTWKLKKIEIKSSLDTSALKNPHFLLQFKSPFRNIEQVDFEATLGDKYSKLEGKLFVMFNNKTILVQLGSVGNHLYLEAYTPITNYETIKFDINHLENSVKTRALLGRSKLDANFNRKGTIYNFDISSDIVEKIIKFYGKIDIASKALQTSVLFDEVKLRMKANSNGQSMSASLTSHFEGIKNIKLRGNWNWDKDGFNVVALGNFLDSSKPSLNEFHAQFHSNESVTHGFWKVVSSKEEILFTMKIEKPATHAMKIFLSIELPEMSPIFCQISFSDDKRFVQGALEFINPWKFVNISFSGGFKSDSEFEFRSIVACPEEIFNLQLIIKVAAIDDIEFKIRCIIPFFDKDFGTVFLFKPNSLYNFQFFTILTINEQKFGGGASLNWNSYEMDVQFSIFTPVISGEYNFGGKYSISLSSVNLQAYFNKANLELKYNLLTGNINGKAKFSVPALISSIFGSNATNSINLDGIEIMLDYTKNENGAFLVKCDYLGRLEASFSYHNSKFSSNFDLLYLSKNISKSGFITVDFKRTGHFEVFLKDGKETFLVEVRENNIAKTRKARAIIESEATGRQEIGYTQNFNQGVFMLLTNSGIHKITYDLKVSDKTNLVIHLESPILNDGFASASFSINNRKQMYESRFSVNNDHFLYAMLKIKDFGVDSSFTIETKKLKDKVSGNFKYNYENGELSSMAEFTYQSNHRITVDVDITNFSANGKMHSPLVPFQDLSLETELLKKKNESTFFLAFSYGKNNFQVEGKLKVKDSYKGSISCRSSEFSKLKFSTNFELQFYHTILLNIDLETAFPQYSKALLHFKLIPTSDKQRDVKFILVLPIQHYELFDMDIKFLKNDNTDYSFRGNMITSHGLYVFNLDMMIGTTRGETRMKIIGPFDAYYYGLMSLDWCSILQGRINFELPLLGKIDMTFFTDSIITSQKNDVNLNIEYEEEFVDFVFGYNFEEAVQISFLVESSLAMLNKNGFSIGFCNTERKMLKLHIQYLGDETGLQFDYHFTEIFDMNFLLKIDLPFHDWSDSYFQVKSIVKNGTVDLIFGFNYNEHILKISLKLLEKILFSEILHQNNSFILNLKNKQNGIIKVKVQNWKAVLKLKNLQSVEGILLTQIALKVKEDMKIVLVHNKFLGNTKIMVKNIIIPFCYASSFYNDQIESPEHQNITTKMAVGAKLNVTWDTLQPFDKSALFGFSVRSYGDAAVDVKFPSTKTVRFQGSSQGTATTSIFILKLQSEDAETSTVLHHQKSIQHKSTNFEKGITKLESSSFCLQQESYSAFNELSSSNYQNVRWGTNRCSFHLGYLERKRKWRKNEEVEIYIFYPEDGELITVSLVKRMKKYKNIYDFKLDHFDDQKKFSLLLIPKYFETPLFMSTGLVIGGSISNSDLQTIYIDSSFSKNYDALTTSVGFNRKVLNMKVSICFVISHEIFVELCILSMS